MGEASELPDVPLLEGVQAFDHTADVGLAVRAPDLPMLFVRAALGMEALIAGDIPGETRAAEAARSEDTDEASAPEIDVAVDAPDVAVLLADWLRELLYYRQVRGRAIARATFSQLSETRLAARVELAADRPGAIREIKGVTYHGLLVERAGDGWRAHIIFDV